MATIKVHGSRVHGSEFPAESGINNDEKWVQFENEQELKESNREL
jgi:hypothetical protein